MKHKFLLINFFCAFTLTFFCKASEYIPCGEDEAGACWPCGDTCTARLSYQNDDDKAHQRNATITYSGYGAMYDYKSPTGNPELIGVEPWYGVKDSITKAVVDEGITTLGMRTIYLMENLTEVSLPDSLQKIGSYAFHSSPVPEIVIPQNVTQISTHALGDASHVGTLICPESIQAQCTKTRDYANSNISINTYQKSGDHIFYNNRWYNSASEIASGNYIKKRIYTVDEANRVTGDVNRITIRYK